MERSKNVAFLFLLGALVVGGALGFSADRLMVRDQICPRWASQRGMRTRLNDVLELSAAQRASVDSILDDSAPPLRRLHCPQPSRTPPGR